MCRLITVLDLIGTALGSRSRSPLPLCVVLLLVLSACGGGGGRDPVVAANGADDGAASMSDPAAADPADPEPDPPPGDGVLGWLRWHDIQGFAGGYIRAIFGVQSDSSSQPAALTPVLTEDDVGQQYEFRRGTSDLVDALFSDLVDGKDRYVWGRFTPYPNPGGYSARGHFESEMEGRPPGLTSADLFGAFVTRVVIEVEHLNINKAGSYTYFDYIFRVTFYGYVLPGIPVGPGGPGGSLDP